MKKELMIYAVLIIIFLGYNFFFRVEDEKTNAIINILFTSFLVLYMGYIAFLMLRKMKNTTRK